MNTYLTALKLCEKQREIQLICYYEIGKQKIIIVLKFFSKYNYKIMMMNLTTNNKIMMVNLTKV